MRLTIETRIKFIFIPRPKNGWIECNGMNNAVCIYALDRIHVLRFDFGFGSTVQCFLLR